MAIIPILSVVQNARAFWTKSKNLCSAPGYDSHDYFVTDANNNGQAVGRAVVNQSYQNFVHGYSIDSNTDTLVPVLWTGTNVSVIKPDNLRVWDYFNCGYNPVCISDNGWIAGNMTIISFGPEGYHWNQYIFLSNNGNMPTVLFSYPPNGYSSIAACRINNAGQILVRCLLPNVGDVFALWSNGIFTNIGTLGGHSTWSSDLNNAGQVVGLSLDTNERCKAFLWQINPKIGVGEMINLNDLISEDSGWNLEYATAINDIGQIVGNGKYNDEWNRAFLLTPKMIFVDYNRDGKISTDGKDNTSKDKRFRFWCNDDDDSNEKDNQSVLPDNRDTLITSKRDLEDFAQMQIKVSPAFKDLVAKGYKLAIETTDDLKINVYKAVAPGTGYLTDETVATSQINGVYHEALDQNDLCSPRLFGGSYITPEDLAKGIIPLIFEGKTAGVGKIRLIIKSPEGNEAASDEVFIDLKNIKDMYERASLDDSTLEPQVLAEELNILAKDPNEKKQLIVYVHGFNNTNWTWQTAESETMFKRLWHQGYKGRFATLRWPSPQFGMIPDEYNRGEWIAWKSGVAPPVNSSKSY